MSDETGNGDFVLHSVSGCYAEVHISLQIRSLSFPFSLNFAIILCIFISL